MQFERNEATFLDLVGFQVVGVERFDGRLLVMFTNGEATKLIEIDRYAKLKRTR